MSDPAFASEDYVDLRDYINLIRAWWWLLALCLVLGAAAAYAVSVAQDPLYRASTRVLVQRAPESQMLDLVYLSDQQLAQTYAEMFKASTILEAAEERIGRTLDPDRVNVEQIRNTQLIEITVTDEDPAAAAAIANTLVEVFIEKNNEIQAQRFASSEESLLAQIQDVQTQIGELQDELVRLTRMGASGQARAEQVQVTLALYQQLYSELLRNYETVRLARLQSTPNLVQVEVAVPPEHPYRPNIPLNVALGGLIGLMVAGFGVLLKEYLDDTVKTPDDVARGLGLPVLGYIAEIEGDAESAYVADHPRSPVAEAFRTLRSNLEFAAVDRPLKSLLVVSPKPGEGKTSVAVNLAVTLTQGGKRVLLLDADMRRPQVHRYLRVPNRRGLSDIFRDSLHIHDVARPWKTNDLAVVTSGALPPNPADLLASARMAQILDTAKELADMVVVDAPPLLVADSVVLASRVDGVLVVLQPGKTSLATAQAVLEQLQRAGARVLGVVFNRVPRNRAYYSGGYEHYYAYYHGKYHAYYGEGGSDGADDGSGSSGNGKNRRSLVGSLLGRKDGG